MTIFVDGSKMRSDAKYGQNGSNTPSSIQIGEKINRSDVAKTIIAGDGSVSANPPNEQTRKVGASPGKPAFGMKNPECEAGQGARAKHSLRQRSPRVLNPIGCGA